MPSFASIEAIAGVIQLAVAPVFLLAGIAGLLGVLSTRLGRIIDRIRVVEQRLPLTRLEDEQRALRFETTALWTRIGLINWAIRLCVSGALTICLVIVALFVGDFVDINIAGPIALLFVLAMVLIIAGLMFFLREIGASTRQMGQSMQAALDADRRSTSAPKS
jgi:hypothetical protein